MCIGVRESILLGGEENKKYAPKLTLGLKTLVSLFYIVEFVYNGFVCNVNSPTTLHFVRYR